MHVRLASAGVCVTATWLALYEQNGEPKEKDDGPMWSPLTTVEDRLNFNSDDFGALSRRVSKVSMPGATATEFSSVLGDSARSIGGR